jgi:hypothetical protein
VIHIPVGNWPISKNYTISLVNHNFVHETKVTEQWYPPQLRPWD